MSWWIAAVGALVGAGAGWFLAGEQWRLYREPEFRAERLSGRKLLVYRIGLAIAMAATTAIALRPDHYDFGPALLTALWCAVFLLVSSTDFERRRIPNKITYAAVPIALALGWVWPDRSWADILIGFAVAGGIAILMYIAGIAVGILLNISATPFGLGDVKLIGLIGALAGWPLVINALFIGVVLAGIPSLFFMLRGRTKHVFSYGPYLSFGAIVALLFAGQFL
jgi:prepilin signal peptidase PulO-like enzyme (type II secretory pathway)